MLILKVTNAVLLKSCECHWEWPVLLGHNNTVLGILFLSVCGYYSSSFLGLPVFSFLLWFIQSDLSKQFSDAVCSLTLTYVMGQRYLQTSKLMPAGVVAALRFALLLSSLFRHMASFSVVLFVFRASLPISMEQSIVIVPLLRNVDNLFMLVLLYVCTHACVRVCIHACMCVYMCIYYSFGWWAVDKFEE